MTETITAGAHGAHRIDLAQYRHAIRQAPELLQHLAHLIEKGRYDDGQPTARDLQAAPGRIAPLDEAEQLFVWLWREAARWIGLAHLEAQPIGHMVRRDEQLHPIGTRRILTTEEGRQGLHADATLLVHVIDSAWPDIETVYGRPETWGATVGEQWAADVDEHLLGPLARWPLDERAAVPARARECPVCGQRDVYADLGTASGVCLSCRHVVQPEVWVTVKDATRILNVGKQTVHDWITAGLETRGKPKKVELGAARCMQEERDIRSRLNLV